MIRVNDGTLLHTSLFDGHVERVDDERRVLSRVNGSTNNAATARVEHATAIDLAFSRRMLRVGVGPERPANISVGGSLRPALRTGRATLAASGSPRSYAIVTADPDCVIVHGVGMRAPRNR